MIQGAFAAKFGRHICLTRRFNSFLYYAKEEEGGIDQVPCLLLCMLVLIYKDMGEGARPMFSYYCFTLGKCIW